MPEFSIVLHRNIPKLSAKVRGKAIAGAEPLLQRLARKLQVVPLTEFHSQSPDEAARKMKASGIDVAGIDLPAETWYAPIQGLQTVMAFREYLADHPATLPNTDDVVAELDAWHEVLAKATAEHVAWHLSIEF
ncbi:hypothetical protein [Bremerella cremea]|uniref:hypothetical protein n=1 Tax=Bremerella cremea TaxID=1031537 RepID=UPI0031ED5981